MRDSGEACALPSEKRGWGSDHGISGRTHGKKVLQLVTDARAGRDGAGAARGDAATVSVVGGEKEEEEPGDTSARDQEMHQRHTGPVSPGPVSRSAYPERNADGPVRMSYC